MLNHFQVHVIHMFLGRMPIAGRMSQMRVNCDMCIRVHASHQGLVGGFKHEFHFPFHIWDNPSH